MHSKLIDQIEKLQLPHPNGEPRDSSWIRDLVDNYQLSADDLALQLESDIAKWQKGNPPSLLIEDVVGRFLEASNRGGDKYALDGETYFKQFNKITKGNRRNWKGLDWRQTQLLLSKARVIGYLQCEELYSASQVAKVLAATDASLNVPFQAVALVGESFGNSIDLPEISTLDELWEEESELGDLLFADTTINESCRVAAAYAAEFTPSATLEQDLLALVETEENAKDKWNYRQILYWQCTILEFYDHPASWLYEFNPRGVKPEHLFSKFEASTRNPFLNNAKGTAKLNTQWALNRGKNDAHALVSILETLEAYPHLASAKTAKILKSWIVRTVKLAIEERALLEILDRKRAYDRLIDTVSATDTNTHGVIEQRVVDALSLLAYGGESWQPTGLGDHVNATNTARQKLGDVEFSSVKNLNAVAIEAHGGQLTKSYIDYHNSSLENSIRNRLESSWLHLADANKWNIDVVYVAHKFSDEKFPQDNVFENVPIRYTYLSYEELAEKAKRAVPSPQIYQAFDHWVLNVLNSGNVAQSVRDKAAVIMGDAVRLVKQTSS